jgi:nucleoside 2-deoxyribosyltransferase
VANPGALAEYVRRGLPQQTASGGKIRIFVAMSFRTEEEPSLVDYYKAMDRAAQRSTTPLELIRMDLVEGDYEISQKIMDEIDISDAVLADFTLGPSNVYFELGYARSKKKPIIQTARKGTGLEFDVRNWRTLLYKNSTELEEILVPAFDNLGKNSDSG